MAPGPGVFGPSRHLAILPCCGQVRPHPALGCGLRRMESRSILERSELVLSAGVSPCPRPGFPSNLGRDANQENDCSSLGVCPRRWAGSTGALPRGQPWVLPPPCPPQPPYSLYPCAGRPLTRRVPPGPSRERRSEGRARRHGASGTYPGALASPGRRSPVAASGQGSGGSCPLDVERLWGPERDRAGCLPSRPGSGPRTLRPCPRDAACWQLGGRGGKHGDQAWLCPLRSGHATDLCPLIPDRVHGACRARLARQESLGEG